MIREAWRFLLVVTTASLLWAIPLLAFGNDEADDWYYRGENQVSTPRFFSDETPSQVIVWKIKGYRAGTVVQQPVQRRCRKWAQLGHPEWAALPDLPDDANYTIRPHVSTDFAKGRFAYVVTLREPGVEGWLCFRQPSVQTYYEDGEE